MYQVMLVEDDARLADLVTEYLAGYEFKVDVVSRGDEAVARFKASPPDIVVLDLMLPGLDGMLVCRQLRDITKVPILIMTAREDSYDEVSLLEQGADDFICAHDTQLVAALHLHGKGVRVFVRRNDREIRIAFERGARELRVTPRGELIAPRENQQRGAKSA